MLKDNRKPWIWTTKEQIGRIWAWFRPVTPTVSRKQVRDEQGRLGKRPPKWLGVSNERLRARKQRRKIR